MFDFVCELLQKMYGFTLRKGGQMGVGHSRMPVKKINYKRICLDIECYFRFL